MTDSIHFSLLLVVGLGTAVVAGVAYWAYRAWLRPRLSLEEALEAVKGYRMSPAEREAQRRSFAYGNAKLSNPAVTREMVDAAADDIQRRRLKDTP